MAGRASAATHLAMRLVLAGVVPYRAAKRANIALSTMYRSSLYMMWKAGKFEALKVALDIEKAAALARKTTKKVAHRQKND